MDTMQIILSACAITVTTVILILAYKLYQTLVQAEKSMIKIDKISDDIESISSSVREPVASFSEFLMGFKNGIVVLNSLAPQLKKLISKKIK